MTTPTLTATDNASIQTPDNRRISETDSDFQRLHAATVKRLQASIRQLVRDLRTAAHPETALAPFIHRHTGLLRAAYDAAHVEGQRDYYERVSAQPNRWLRDLADLPQGEATARTRLAFYGVSVARMASEALQAYRTAAHAQIATTDAHRGISLDDAGGDELDQWAGGTGVRIELQADIVWPGMQDGYLQAGATDRTALYALVYWLLEPLARHCDGCLSMAGNNPYNAPGLGGNDLLAVPGDGHTECGANCKCSLSYEPQGALDQRMWDRVWNQLWRPQGSPLPDVTLPPPPSDDTYSMQQQAALDAYRAAADGWDEVRGRFPAAPGLFATDTGATDIALPGSLNWAYLEPDQQDALTRLYGALGAWDTATKYGASEEQ